MTFPFAAMTVGLILIYTAFRNATVGEILRGEEDKSAGNTSFLGEGVSTRLASFVSGSGSSGANASGSSGGVSPGEFKNVKGVTQWGDKQIASWIAKYLRKIGCTPSNTPLSSGYRTPAYSESLCYDMCGAPSCSGTCAGRSSNHSGKIFPAGAIDVVNPTALQARIDKAAKKGIPRLLKNDLPADRVHYSNSGH